MVLLKSANMPMPTWVLKGHPKLNPIFGPYLKYLPKSDFFRLFLLELGGKTPQRILEEKFSLPLILWVVKDENIYQKKALL